MAAGRLNHKIWGGVRVCESDDSHGDERGCTYVVVASRFVDLEHLDQYQQALEVGRADFLNKTYMNRDTTFLSVFSALKKGRLKLQTQWNQWLRVNLSFDLAVFGSFWGICVGPPRRNVTHRDLRSGPAASLLVSTNAREPLLQSCFGVLA